MKKIAFVAAVATLIAAPAFAQSNQPAFQTGGGQRAGGPANELNPSGGMAPMGAPRATDNQPAYQTGGGQRAGGPANELNPSTGMAPTTGSVNRTDNQPAYQTGSGQRAGGPANELNSSTGVPGVGSRPMQNQK